MTESESAAATILNEADNDEEGGSLPRLRSGKATSQRRLSTHKPYRKEKKGTKAKKQRKGARTISPMGDEQDDRLKVRFVIELTCSAFMS